MRGLLHTAASDPALLARSPTRGFATAVTGAVAAASRARDRLTVAQHTGGSSEVMFANGIDLLGAEAPTHIHCADASQRSGVLAQLASAGISSIGGRPVHQVVT